MEGLFATAIRGVVRTVEICHNSRSQYHKLKELRVMNRSTLGERRSPLGCFPGQPTPRLYDRVVEVLRARHYSPRTEEAYLHWIRRFTLFHAGAHPRELGEGHVNTFLTHLAVKENVAASTQNQALAALLFLYGHVLEQPLNRIEGVIRARKPKRLPVVLTSDEVEAVLAHLNGVQVWCAHCYTVLG
jgi:integrase